MSTIAWSMKFNKSKTSFSFYFICE